MMRQTALVIIPIHHNLELTPTRADTEEEELMSKIEAKGAKTIHATINFGISPDEMEVTIGMTRQVIENGLEKGIIITEIDLYNQIPDIQMKSQEGEAQRHRVELMQNEIFRLALHEGTMALIEVKALHHLKGMVNETQNRTEGRNVEMNILLE